MKRRWYVIDSQENLPTYNDKTELHEHFSTKEAAMKRAASSADEEPHKAFLVCESTDYVVVETKPVIARPCIK